MHVYVCVCVCYVGILGIHGDEAALLVPAPSVGLADAYHNPIIITSPTTTGINIHIYIYIETHISVHVHHCKLAQVFIT